QPGLETTGQDNGRKGNYELGMPPSGAMDTYSSTISNIRVCKDESAAVLEMKYMRAGLGFDEDTEIACSCGEMPAKINDEPIEMWEAVNVKAGDVLSFEFIKQGARVYLAIQGGIDVPVVMDSRATYTLCGLGGLDGRALQEGDVLPVGKAKNRSEEQ